MNILIKIAIGYLIQKNNKTSRMTSHSLVGKNKKRKI